MQKTEIINSKFVNFFYKFFLVFLIASIILLFIITFKINESYFLKFSADNFLTESTISKIHVLESVVIGVNIIFLLGLLFILHNELEFKMWIVRHNNKLKNILLLLFIIFLFFLCLELTLKFMLKFETTEYGFGPGSTHFNENYVKLNNEGFRGKSFEIAKPKDTIRIAVIGDSFTFGSGVNDFEKTYSRLLEKNLNLNGEDKYEILTFALPGRDTIHEIGLIKNNTLKYNPDIIIIGYVLNDFPELEAREYDQQITLIPYFGFFLRQVSYSYYFFETRINRMIENLGFRKTFEDTLIQRYNSTINQKYNEELFNEISSISKEHQIGVYIVLFPMIHQLEDYKFNLAHEIIKNTSINNNFFFLDLLDEYKKYNMDEIILNKYDRHPNELGHKIAADKITSILKQDFINKKSL